MATKWNPRDDPLSDRQASYDAQKGFKGGKFPSRAFPERKVRKSIDEFYQPFKGKVKK